MWFFEILFVPLQPKGCETAPARQLMHCNATLCTFRSEKHHCSRSTAVLAPEISYKYVFIMATMTLPQTSQIIVTLEDNALVADIKRALKMIRGIASVRTATISDDHTITPAMRRSINKARREYAKGETIKCSTPEEMQRYFDSL
jgi:hypothetical protein